ncbi:hypothetical protein LOD99_5436 [Oopsacas minuta]|uniref:Uncharacterized protein n=1 Tax=Oopsacas minuta TaxID=111878 RepID=A0AAV7JQX7_9METZ|nr:hypothetical protein LOD99_5436 [Oopsacas minuta]
MLGRVSLEQVQSRTISRCFSKCGFMRNEGQVANIGMPEVTLEELELQGMEAADAGIVFALMKTITQLVKEPIAKVGKVREEDPQKNDCEDEEPIPVPSSAAAAQAIETLLLYATGRGDVGILNGSMDLDAYEEFVRGRRVSELVQTKISYFPPKSPTPRIILDMMD